MTSKILSTTNISADARNNCDTAITPDGCDLTSGGDINITTHQSKLRAIKIRHKAVVDARVPVLLFLSAERVRDVPCSRPALLHIRRHKHAGTREKRAGRLHGAQQARAEHDVRVWHVARDAVRVLLQVANALGRNGRVARRKALQLLNAITVLGNGIVATEPVPRCRWWCGAWRKIRQVCLC